MIKTFFNQKIKFHVFKDDYQYFNNISILKDFMNTAATFLLHEIINPFAVFSRKQK